MAVPQPGGFLQPGILSPPLSNASSSMHPSTLPTPRRRPLRPGSPKETAFINYVDRRIQQIRRRYVKKLALEGEPTHASAIVVDGESADPAKGYKSFKDASADIERLVELVWFSGTPSLQIPYLLVLAMLVPSYLPAFSPAPKATVSLLGKLDAAFVSLLQGVDEDGATLPGFGPGEKKGVTATEKVRIKGIVEKTRVIVVAVMNRSEFEYEEEDEDLENEDGDDRIDEDFERGNDWDLEIARVYEKTLLELGDSLTGPAIGIPDN